MVDVLFRYVDGNEIVCSNIESITINTSNGYTEIKSNELMSCKLRHYGEFYLYSKDSNYTITTKGLLSSQIKQK